MEEGSSGKRSLDQSRLRNNDVVKFQSKGSYKFLEDHFTEISILMFKTKLYSDKTMPPRHVSKENMG